MPTPEELLKHLRDATLALARTTAARDELLARQHEPIAIIGMACRLPGGVDGPDSLWKLLEEGKDAVRSVEERWKFVGADPQDDGPKWAGLLDEIDGFDPAFFGISPREAVALDPNQRLLLEVSWEALENAGVSPRSLEGSRTGVFIGASATDYQRQVVANAEGWLQEPYCFTGNALCVAAGRLSYALGLQGPSAIVDTACSSSLVAVHLACRSLRSRESELALAGGVNLILATDTMNAVASIRALSPDGRCRTFDAGASGFVRSEGCGVIVLKRLSDARRDGDPIWAVIRGSAMNQDGRSTGLTAPNVLAQESLLRDALASARLKPEAVGYVETHGTGTPLGDPIEVEALRNVLGQPRATPSRLVLGALKTNIGHAEAASGIAGLVKAVLCLRHERIPRNIHFRKRNPRVLLDDSALVLATEDVPWPRAAEPRIAGVSSFGISGTNSHVLIEEAPVVAPQEAASARPVELVVLSGKTPAALDAVVDRLRGHLDAHPDVALGDLAFNLATTRAHHEHRLALAVSSREELREALDATARGERVGVRGEVGPVRGKVAWLFTGQGAQTLGMGCGLYEQWPAFREALDAAFAALDPHLERPLREVMWGDDSARLDATAFTQPALFALEWALAALWRSWGAEPSVLAGHSIGELAAACVAGVFSLEDAARLVAARGRLMQALPAGGAMVAIGTSEGEIASALAPYAQSVSIAAVNALDSVVISGDEDHVLRIAEQFAAKGVRTKRLAVSHAFHSPRMVPMLDDFRRVAQSIAYKMPSVPVVSNVTGALAGPELATAEYWVDHVRAAVRFAQGVRTLHADGVSTFVELGPKPTLLGLVPGCLDSNVELVLLSSLRTDRPDAEAILAALAGLFVQGQPVDWKALFPKGGRRLELPTYPWQRQRYWMDPKPRTYQAGNPTGHPLLGARIPTVVADAVYETVLAASAPSWLEDHRIADYVLVPGTAVAELMHAAAEDFLGRRCELTNTVFQYPIILPEQGARRVQIVLTEGGAQAAIYSQPADAPPRTPWMLHASSQPDLDAHPEAASPGSIDLDAIRKRCPVHVDGADFYAAFEKVGHAYGPTFRGVRAISRGDGEVLAELSPPEGIDGKGYGFHPAYLDAALQASVGVRADFFDSPTVPFEIGRLVVHRQGWTSAAVAHLKAAPAVGGAGDTHVFDFFFADEAGVLIAEGRGLCGRSLDPAALLARSGESVAADAVFRVDWPKLDAPKNPAVATGRWLLVAAADDAVATALEAALRHGNATCERVGVDRLAGALPADHVVVCFRQDASPEEAIRAATDGLAVVQALSGQAAAPRLWCVTRHAVAVHASDRIQPSAAAVWGLGRTVAAERPELRCTLVDVDSEDAAASALLRELASPEVESQVAWRAGQRHVARLVKAPTPASPAPATARSTRNELRTDGTVLITGGLGALGREVARWLAARHVPHLVLTGRRGLDAPGAAEAVAELEALGARVTVAAVDATQRDALARVLSQIPSDLPLRGVVHAAGVLDDGVLSEQTPERFQRVMAPKVTGAWNLHALTTDADLDFFVLFSSVAGTFGAPGQAPYAAANVYLDALAAHRRDMGLPGVSLAWGPWAEGGMVATLEANLQARLARQGISMLSAEQGLALFGEALRRPESLLLLVPLQLRVVAKAYGSTVPALWRTLVVPSRTKDSKGNWASELSGLSAEQRRNAVIETVRAEVARVLSLGGAHLVAADRPLKDLGLDSLMAIELRNALSRRAGTTLPATLAFEYPTPAAIAGYLADSVLGTEAPSAPKESRNTPTISAIRLQTALPRARLFCFHNAGGIPESFAGWVPSLPHDIELQALPYARAGQGTPADGDGYIKAVVEAIRGQANVPYAIFGHSLGALFAWRVSAALIEAEVAPPSLLMVSAFRAPTTPRPEQLSEVDGRQLIALLSPNKVSSDTVSQALVDAFVGDVRLAEAMSLPAHPQLPIPIVAFVGSQDPWIRSDDMERWREVARGSFKTETLPGDHFYLFEETAGPRLVEAIARQLSLIGRKESALNVFAGRAEEAPTAE